MYQSKPILSTKVVVRHASGGHVTPVADKAEAFRLWGIEQAWWCNEFVSAIRVLYIGSRTVVQIFQHDGRKVVIELGEQAQYPSILRRKQGVRPRIHHKLLAVSYRKHNDGASGSFQNRIVEGKMELRCTPLRGRKSMYQQGIGSPHWEGY